MDIWAWVREARKELRAGGHTRLAEILYSLPSAVCDDQHARVDALVAEALPLARSTKNPWLELFVRHWDLQSRVRHREEAKESLADAVSLLELASRPEVRECPQAICVTQDLASCYATRDGPGYVSERLEVARETLERINPRWPCFLCISGEYATALLDAERYQEAVEFIDQQRRAIAASGRERQTSAPLLRDRAKALLCLGRVDEALMELEQYDDPAAGSSGALSARLLMTQALARAERFDDAKEQLPPGSAVVDTPSHYEDWILSLKELLERDQLDNSWQLTSTFATMVDRLENNGSYYRAAWLCAVASQFAARRGARALTELWLERSRALDGQLRKSASLLPLRDRALELLSVHEEEPLVAISEELIDADADPELALDQLARLQLTPALRRKRARCLQLLGFARAAESAYRELIDEGDRDALGELGETLLARGKHAELEGLASEQRDDLGVEGLWLLARSRVEAGEWEEAQQALERIIEGAEVTPAPVSGRSLHTLARTLLARVLRERGELPAALELLDEVTQAEEPGDWDWERLVTATLLRSWPQVRESAARLGMELEGEGPVDEAWGLVQVRYETATGYQVHYAERTGPVTARVLELSGPEGEEHKNDEVVFDAEPANPLQEGEDEHDWIPIFRVLGILREGGLRSYTIDGVHPGARGEAALRALFDRIAGAFEVRSGEGYALRVDGDEVPGMFGYFGVPRDMPPREVHDLLSRVTERFEHPLVWLELAEELDAPAEVERQQEHADRYNL